MSTGAWIFAGLVTAAIVAPATVYAAATSTVAIGNTSNSQTATVTGQHQLLTVPISPKDVIAGAGGITQGGACGTIYTPPAGKAFVLTEITYDLGSGSAGTESYAVLGCGHGYADYADTTAAYEAQSHTFPTGLPMATVSVENGTSTNAIFVTFSGYLIPASQLPPAPAHGTTSTKGLPPR